MLHHICVSTSLCNHCLTKENNLDNIRCFKLVSGLDLIGKLKEEDSEKIVLDEAFIASLAQTQQGLSLNFVPLAFLSDKDVEDGKTATIHRQNILLPYTPHPDLVKSYIHRTSKIELASAPGLSIVKP